MCGLQVYYGDEMSVAGLRGKLVDMSTDDDIQLSSGRTSPQRDWRVTKVGVKRLGAKPASLPPTFTPVRPFLVVPPPPPPVYWLPYPPLIRNAAALPYPYGQNGVDESRYQYRYAPRQSLAETLREPPYPRR